MKRILIFILVFSALLLSAAGLFAQTSNDATLKSTVNSNVRAKSSYSAFRNSGVFDDIIDAKKNIVDPFTTSGTDTYAGTSQNPINSYQTGLQLIVDFATANTGASTLNINEIGPVAVEKEGEAVVAGDLLGPKLLYFDGTAFQIVGDGGIGITQLMDSLSTALDSLLSLSRADTLYWKTNGASIITGNSTVQPSTDNTLTLNIGFAGLITSTVFQNLNIASWGGQNHYRITSNGSAINTVANFTTFENSASVATGFGPGIQMSTERSGSVTTNLVEFQAPLENITTGESRLDIFTRGSSFQKRISIDETGAYYPSDLSSGYTDRHLTEKAYVDGSLLGNDLAAPTGSEVGQSIRWNAGGTAWEYYTPGAGGGITKSDAIDTVFANLKKSRTVTSQDTIVQADQFKVVKLNSGTPFTFVIDSLNIGTQVTLRNLGSATVTLTDKSYVTSTGASTLAAGEDAVVIYTTATEPEIKSTADVGGDVTKDGTPADNQLGVWTGDGTIEGTSSLTYSSSTFSAAGGFDFYGAHQRIRYNEAANLLYTTKLSASASSSLTVSASPGISASPNGQTLIIDSGSGYASGNGNGGNIQFSLGSGTGTGVDGNVDIGGNPATFQSMEKGIYIRDVNTPPSGSPTGGVFLYVDNSDGRLKLVADDGETYEMVIPTSATTGTSISFTKSQIYNAASPATGNFTNNLTGARIGIVQKVYHDDSSEPTYPAGWVLVSGVYDVSKVNIYFIEWVSGTTVEYSIAQQNP